METIKRTFGLAIVFVYLSACTTLANDKNVLLRTSPTYISTQTMTPTPRDTPLPASTTSPVITPLGEPGINSVIPTQTEVALEQSITGITSACQLDPITQPPPLDKKFLPNELDLETNLHVTGRPQWIEITTYRLNITGLVDHPLSLTYDELRCMPKVTDNPELVCPGVFTDYATWTGVPIVYILRLAGVQEGATQLILVSADGYDVHLPLETASEQKNFLAYEVHGKPLPIQHGFPLRAVFPDMWGSYWLKWLVEIRIS